MLKKGLMLVLAAVLICSAAFPAAALGNDHLVIDSSTRRMTTAECWNWSYEALGFVYHEILARHGFVFDPNGQYGWYFSAQDWYHAIASRNNQDVYNLLNNTEWYNIDLIKSVRDNMQKTNNYNPGGRQAPQRNAYYQPHSAEPDLSLNGFIPIRVNGNLKLPVYSAPGINSWRGANGKALCNTDGGIYAAGRDGGWVMILYYLNRGVNQGGCRVGYVQYSQLTGLMDNIPLLNFLNKPVRIASYCQLTDDPVYNSSQIMSLSPNTYVTLLMHYKNENNTKYAYVETICYGQTVRGFVPLECVEE